MTIFPHCPSRDHLLSVCIYLLTKFEYSDKAIPTFEINFDRGRAGGLKIITSRACSLTCFCISKFLLTEKHLIVNCCLGFCGNVNSTLLIGSKMFLML